jgi:hypothetical protein
VPAFLPEVSGYALVAKQGINCIKGSKEEERSMDRGRPGPSASRLGHVGGHPAAQKQPSPSSFKEVINECL